MNTEDDDDEASLVQSERDEDDEADECLNEEGSQRFDPSKVIKQLKRGNKQASEEPLESKHDKK